MRPPRNQFLAECDQGETASSKELASKFSREWFVGPRPRLQDEIDILRATFLSKMLRPLVWKPLMWALMSVAAGHHQQLGSLVLHPFMGITS